MRPGYNLASVFFVAAEKFGSLELRPADPKVYMLVSMPEHCWTTESA